MSNHFCQIQQIRSLSFSELEFFLTLYRVRSISATAKRHEIAISVASRLLKKLRVVFDDQLFVRSNPLFLPTDRAHALAVQIEEILRRTDAMATPDVFDPKTLQRTFRIAAVDNAVLIVLKDFIHHFYTTAPHCVLEFQNVDRALFHKLESGRIDVAILPSLSPVPNKVHEMRLYELKQKLCVRQGHPLDVYYREHGRLPLDEISKYRKIIIANQLSNEDQIYSLDEMYLLGRQHQDVGLSVPYFTPIPSILEETDLTVVLPDETAQSFQRRGTPIAILPYGDPENTFSYWTRIIWHERTHYDTVMQWFRGMFSAYASKKTRSD